MSAIIKDFRLAVWHLAEKFQKKEEGLVGEIQRLSNLWGILHGLNVGIMILDLDSTETFKSIESWKKSIATNLESDLYFKDLLRSR